MAARKSEKDVRKSDKEKTELEEKRKGWNDFWTAFSKDETAVKYWLKRAMEKE